MEKYLVKEFASEIIAQTRGRISRIDAEALAIVYIAKMKMIYPIYIHMHIVKELIYGEFDFKGHY